MARMAGMAGLEPTKCQSQSLVPYRLGYIPTSQDKEEIGWDGRTRTCEMPEPESGALPTWRHPNVPNNREYSRKRRNYTVKVYIWGG